MVLLHARFIVAAPFLVICCTVAIAGCGGSSSSSAPISIASGGRSGSQPGSGGNGGNVNDGSGGNSTSIGTGGRALMGSGGNIDLATGGSTSSGSGGASTGSGGVSSASGGSALPGSGGTSIGGRSGTSTGGSVGTATGGRGGTVGIGSGGSQGVGGSSGTANGQCPSNAIFCADFESGGIPAQAAFFPEYLRTTMSTYVTVDSSMGLNSARSAKFAGTSFSQMLGVATGTPTFWTRVYIRADVDMGTINGHATYIAATDGNGDPNMGEHVRVGEHSCQLELNRRSDDKELLSNGGNYMCTGGIVFAKNTWYCLETFYNGPGREVRVLVNGAESTPLHVTDWGPYSYGLFKFGFENYSSPMRNIWYDDVAIAPQRIGCH